MFRGGFPRRCLDHRYRRHHCRRVPRFRRPQVLTRFATKEGWERPWRLTPAFVRMGQGCADSD